MTTKSDGLIEGIFEEAAHEADLYYCFLDGEGAKALDGSETLLVNLLSIQADYRRRVRSQCDIPCLLWV